LCPPSYSDECLPDAAFAEGITVDLREPVFEEGVLTTEQGGVVTAPDLRIQARRIVYTKKTVEGAPVYNIVAEGDLMLEYDEIILVGDRLEYDFQTRTGFIENGRTATGPWFIAGDRIEICPDGGFTIINGFVTTSENRRPEWQIQAETTYVALNQYIEAHAVRFKFMDVPLVKVSKFRANLKAIFDNPLRFYARWGGKQGPRGGVIYEVISNDRFKAFARFDYRLNRGPGGGVETYYRSSDGKEIFQTINYAANDNCISDLHEKIRYRFQGIYRNKVLDDKVSIDLTYDKLSDLEMPTDYNDRGLELDTAGRTQLELIRKEENWIANFLGRVRVNQFQTVKQELPTFGTSWRPFEIGHSGVISENFFKASYLDFTYANDFTHAIDYNATRVELQNHLYRPFHKGVFKATPELGSVLIFYGNSPKHDPRWLFLGKAGIEVNTSLYRNFCSGKHLIEPYVNYNYLTSPTINPHQHYIFDIDDGWFRLNTARIGCRQQLICHDPDGLFFRSYWADIWTNAFIDTPAVKEAFPKLYGRLQFNTFPTLHHTLQTAWNFHARQVDHFNIRTLWTYSKDFALSGEYRHRCAFDWRKADHLNFILDSFRSINELRHSPLSDRRDTLLLHLFYRLNPTWSVECESRHGWNRHREPAYDEYEIDLSGRLRGGWNVRFSYQHREDTLDDRFAIYITFGFDKPEREVEEARVPFLEF
jgi:hypothetical protein